MLSGLVANGTRIIFTRLGKHIVDFCRDVSGDSQACVHEDDLIRSRILLCPGRVISFFWSGNDMMAGSNFIFKSYDHNILDQRLQMAKDY